MQLSDRCRRRLRIRARLVRYRRARAYRLRARHGDHADDLITVALRSHFRVVAVSVSPTASAAAVACTLSDVCRAMSVRRNTHSFASSSWVHFAGGLADTASFSRPLEAYGDVPIAQLTAIRGSAFLIRCPPPRLLGGAQAAQLRNNKALLVRQAIAPPRGQAGSNNQPCVEVTSLSDAFYLAANRSASVPVDLVVDGSVLATAMMKSGTALPQPTLEQLQALLEICAAGADEQPRALSQVTLDAALRPYAHKLLQRLQALCSVHPVGDLTVYFDGHTPRVKAGTTSARGQHRHRRVSESLGLARAALQQAERLQNTAGALSQHRQLLAAAASHLRKSVYLTPQMRAYFVALLRELVQSSPLLGAAQTSFELCVHGEADAHILWYTRTHAHPIAVTADGDALLDGVSCPIIRSFNLGRSSCVLLHPDRVIDGRDRLLSGLSKRDVAVIHQLAGGDSSVCHVKGIGPRVAVDAL